MKNIIKSLLVVVAVAAIAGGATWAYFSDSETSTGNTFTAGTATIALDGDASNGAAYFTAANMKPGDTVTKYVAVKNTGSINLLFRAYVNATTNTASTTNPASYFADVLETKITLNPTDVATWTPRFDPVSNYVNYNSNMAGIIGVSNAIDNDPEAFTYGADQQLQPNEYAVYKVEVTLPTTAGNEWQGASFVGDLVFEGVQFDNQTNGAVVWN